MLKNILSKKKILSLFILIGPMIFSPYLFSYAAGVSIEQISPVKTSYLPGESILFKAVFVDGSPAPSLVNVNLSSMTGGEFSTANLTPGECTGTFSVGFGGINIASGTRQKAFCYRNYNSGPDTITATFTLGSSSEQTTFDVTIDCPPNLAGVAKVVAVKGCEDELPPTGILLVQKLVRGENEPNLTQFSFSINDLATTSFPSDGIVILEKEVGEYNVIELPVEGYEVSYDGCTQINVNSEATSTCTITNTKLNELPSPNLYKVSGQVWDDDDEDGIREEGEKSLPGWVVNITDGTTTIATTTDEYGYYYFMVPVGSWTITENLPENWQRTTPESYTVIIREEEEELYAWSIWRYLVPTAQAATTEITGKEYSRYDFGNNEIPQTISTTDNNRGGSSSGGRRKIIKNNPATSTILVPTPIPTPQVLGEQISIVPIGAPNTGAGGTSPLPAIMTVGHLLYVRRLPRWQLNKK